MSLHARWDDDPCLCGQLHYCWEGHGQHRPVCLIYAEWSKKIILTNGESIHKFLGIEIKRLGPQEFEISQPFLIDQIVTFLSLKSEEYEIHCNDKFTPAVMQVLNKDLNGEANEDIVEVSDSCRHDVLFT